MDDSGLHHDGEGTNAGLDDDDQPGSADLALCLGSRTTAPPIAVSAEAFDLLAGRRPRVERAERGRFGLDPGSRCHDFHRAC